MAKKTLQSEIFESLPYTFGELEPIDKAKVASYMAGFFNITRCRAIREIIKSGTVDIDIRITLIDKDASYVDSVDSEHTPPQEDSEHTPPQEDSEHTPPKEVYSEEPQPTAVSPVPPMEASSEEPDFLEIGKRIEEEQKIADESDEEEPVYQFVIDYVERFAQMKKKELKEESSETGVRKIEEGIKQFIETAYGKNTMGANWIPAFVDPKYQMIELNINLDDTGLSIINIRSALHLNHIELAKDLMVEYLQFMNTGAFLSKGKVIYKDGDVATFNANPEMDKLSVKINEFLTDGVPLIERIWIEEELA